MQAGPGVTAPLQAPQVPQSLARTPHAHSLDTAYPGEHSPANTHHPLSDRHIYGGVIQPPELLEGGKGVNQTQVEGPVLTPEPGESQPGAHTHIYM